MKSASILPMMPPTSESDMKLDISTFNYQGNKYINASIKSIKENTRTPVNICAVVDVSGSMGVEAQNGDAESQGLSVLDIVKHAIKTIINSLTDQDKFALVAYSTEASLKLELINMDDDGKENACGKVDELCTEGQTNIWDGLYTGLEVLNNGQDESHISSIFLLTDGQPNIIPPRGHVGMMKQYFESHELKCSVNTFGFGYSLDSKELLEISNEGQGQFAFIPDGSFVGTVFIHAMSNILSTIANNLILKVSITDEDSVECIGYEKTSTSWGFQVPVGSLIDGQSKDVMFCIPEDKSFDIHFDYKQINEQLKTISYQNNQAEESDNTFAIINYVRTQFIKNVKESIIKFNENKQVEAQELISSFATEIKEIIQANNMSDNEQIQDILADVEGHVTEAFSRQDWFTKWGRHYLLSLLNAHHLQQCNNFKDPGVQYYGKNSPLFNSIRDTAEQIFIKLPPPTRSAVSSAFSYGGNSTHVAVATPVDMSAYYNAEGGCFVGSSLVTKYNKDIVRVDTLKSGDKIKSYDGLTHKYVKIVNIIKTEISKDKPIKMIKLGNLTITNWHPVMLLGNWIFPAEVGKKINIISEEYKDISYVYNLILEDGATNAIIDDIPVITLGHGIKDDPVASHEYYGSKKVIEDINNKFKPDKDGVIEISANVKYVRDTESGLVNGFNI